MDNLVCVQPLTEGTYNVITRGQGQYYHVSDVEGSDASTILGGSEKSFHPSRGSLKWSSPSSVLRPSEVGCAGIARARRRGLLAKFDGRGGAHAACGGVCRGVQSPRRAWPGRGDWGVRLWGARAEGVGEAWADSSLNCHCAALPLATGPRKKDFSDLHMNSPFLRQVVASSNRIVSPSALLPLRIWVWGRMVVRAASLLPRPS